MTIAQTGMSISLLLWKVQLSRVGGL